VVAPPPRAGQESAVPRFFFHPRDGERVRDDDGIELPDAEAARRAAIAGIRSIIADEVRKGRLRLGARLDVEDETGARLFSLSVQDAVSIET
jgi:hypothetical protein